MKVSRRPLGLLVMGVLVASSGCGIPSYAMPNCPPAEGGDVLITMAQAVPSATHVPCLERFPVGWNFGGQNIESGLAEFWLYSDRAGDRAVTVTLAGSCDVSRAVEVPIDADEVGTRRYEEPRALPPNFAGNRYYVFPGGCITYVFDFSRGGTYSLVVEATEALSFVTREEGVQALREEGLILCGREVVCPG